MSAPLAVTQLTLIAAAASFGGCSSDAATGPKPASLSIAAAPKIVLSPTSMTIYARRYFQSPRVALGIKNGGGGTLRWTASTTSSWIILSATSGTAPSTVEVSVNTKTNLGGYSRGIITVS